MTISRGPVIRLALGYLTIIAVVAAAGGYAARQLDAAARHSAALAREHVPGLAAAINVERLALRALGAPPRDPQSAWYLEKAGEAIAQAMATLDPAAFPAQLDAARQTRDAFEKYSEAKSARRDAEKALEEAHDILGEAHAKAVAAAGAAREQWEALSPDARSAQGMGLGLAGVWEAHDQLNAAARLAAFGAGTNRLSFLEEAGWRMQSVRRLLETEGIPQAEGGDASAGEWHAALAGFASTARDFGVAIDQVRAAAVVLAGEVTAAATAEEALWRQAQGFTRSCLTNADSVALKAAAAMDTLAGVWWLALAMLLVVALAISLVTIASTGRSLEEANLPMLCQCGKLNAPTSRFCGRCGQEFT
jgi:hypothetical protein